ncbi:hypothetical protein HHL23_11025 [Chryseobacterium sp. RP-3-3]|uniref:Lipocalin-like domain-containing protein n=1 Tax=Chryseobacterium antibioticum TaxID=2728847 RepID=A0A7Y0AN30_9FLAO|nr:hypothetical protein [Chryseobacterium antibioticum]NML70330.1 hypothetical protein [Chryseobacterium antibioticum]
MKNLILILCLSSMFSCSKVQEKTNTNTTSKEFGLNKEWNGTYHAEAINRDNAKTAFDIIIKSLDNISVNINEDGNKESYSNIKAEIINKDKIKIIYNSSFENGMGTIFIEKSDDQFYISGNPIYFINPGNNEMPLTKLQ